MRNGTVSMLRIITSSGVGLSALAASSPAMAYTARTEDYVNVIGIVVFLVLLVVIYFIPAMVAFRRKHPNRWPILLINFVFGGTGLGWFGTLIWACGAVHKSETGSNGGESGLNVFVNDPVTVKLAPGSEPRRDHDGLADKLQRLKKLFDDGAISAEEYAGLKKPILDQLT